MEIEIGHRDEIPFILTHVTSQIDSPDRISFPFSLAWVGDAQWEEKDITSSKRKRRKGIASYNSYSLSTAT